MSVFGVTATRLFHFQQEFSNLAIVKSKNSIFYDCLLSKRGLENGKYLEMFAVFLFESDVFFDVVAKNLIDNITFLIVDKCKVMYVGKQMLCKLRFSIVAK